MAAEIKFNVEKEKRKALVAAIGEIINCKPRYCGAPSFAFEVGAYTINRYGTVSFHEPLDSSTIAGLLKNLEERGFAYVKEPVQEPDTSDVLGGLDDTGTPCDIESVTTGANQSEEEINTENDEHSGDSISVRLGESAGTTPNTVDAEHPTVGTGNRLSIELPDSGFPAVIFNNLEKLIASKAWIYKKMTGANELPVERVDGRLRFSWFKQDAVPAEIDAYTRLVTRLCETAKTKQRVLGRDCVLKPDENEKYKARCVLLSLGFIGREYASARKILLAALSGCGSFLKGNHKKETIPAQILVKDTNTICNEEKMASLH